MAWPRVRTSVCAGRGRRCACSCLQADRCCRSGSSKPRAWPGVPTHLPSAPPECPGPPTTAARALLASRGGAQGGSGRGGGGRPAPGRPAGGPGARAAPRSPTASAARHACAAPPACAANKTSCPTVENVCVFLQQLHGQPDAGRRNLPAAEVQARLRLEATGRGRRGAARVRTSRGWAPECGRGGRATRRRRGGPQLAGAPGQAAGGGVGRAGTGLQPCAATLQPRASPRASGGGGGRTCR